MTDPQIELVLGFQFRYWRRAAGITRYQTGFNLQPKDHGTEDEFEFEDDYD
jgi:hypothetical protein